MKIQIDTVEKTIKTYGEINLEEFVDQVKKLLPNEEWKDYKFEAEQLGISYPVNPYMPTYDTIPCYITTTITGGDLVLKTFELAHRTATENLVFE